MSDNTVRLSMVGQILRWRWRLLAVLAAVGALVGVGASLLLSPGYETSASVLLQGPREPDELVTEAQVAMSTVVLDRAAAALRWEETGTDLQDSVTAEVADGNVIEIFGTADTPERAQQLADQVAEEYVTFSSQIVTDTGDASGQVLTEQRDALRQQIAQTNDRITELHSAAAQGTTVESVQVRTELEALRQSLAQAMTTLEEAEGASSRANMVVMGPAARPESAAAPTMTHFAAGGAVVFLLLGVFGHLIAARADRRVHNETQVAAALGAPILASLDVPITPQATRPDSWLARLRHVLLADLPWRDTSAAHVDDLGRDLRYRRVLQRLRGPAPQLVVVVPQGDTVATEAVRRLADAADASDPKVATIQVTPARPTVPDAEPGQRMVVVVTAGTRTAWELVGINEACTDAGWQLAGTVVTHPVAASTDDREQTVPTQNGVMAGSP